MIELEKTVAQTALPPVPQTPSIWNVQNILVFIASAATFIVGVLAEVGTILPAGTSHTVAVVSGVIGQVGALAATMGTIFSHNSTVAKVANAQATIHVANLEAHARIATNSST